MTSMGCGYTIKREEVHPIIIDSVSPERVGTVMVSLLNVLQDAPCSAFEKAAAVSCLFREVVELCRTNGSLRSNVTEFLEFAENLSTEQVTGLPKPEFRACHEFVKNELAKDR